MKGLYQDVKFGLRMMARNPWFTFVSVLTLAMGIGVNSAGFAIANGVWWKRMPFQNPKEIVALVMSDGSTEPAQSAMSYAEFVDIQSRARSFKDMAAFEQDEIVLGSEGSLSERYPGAHITPNLFTFLGIKPIRGRDFTPDDVKPGAPLVVMISHEIWQGRFGGREDAVGRSVRIDTVPATIIGITPPGFKFPYSEKIWAPFLQRENLPRSLRSVVVLGRLSPGTVLEAARSEVRGIGQNLARNFPDTNKGYEAIVLPLIDWMTGPDANTPVLMIFGAAASVLLIACVNVANLLLSRSVQRSREIAVRTAIGASRWRIIRQVLVESVMLSLAGGLFGLFLAEVGTRWLTRALATVDLGMPFWINFEMDYRVTAYFFLSCIATGIAFGSVPALQISRTNVNHHLKEGARQATGGFRARRMTSLLLVAEIALTTTLLAEAGLLMKGFLQAVRMEMGFDTRHLLVAHVTLPWNKYRSNPERIAFVDAFMERLNRPGRSATVALAHPRAGAMLQPLKLDGRDASKTGTLTIVDTLPVHAGYFRTLDVKLKLGRDFEHEDGSAGSEVAIVNERFAARYWPTENPIGKRLRVGKEMAPWLQVVGVSPDIFQVGNAVSGPRPLVYVPFRQNPVQSFSVLVHTAESSGATATELRTEAAKLDPDLALYDVMTLDEEMRMDEWSTRVFVAILGIFSVMALVMSSVGLYGVTAHAVSQRTQEIGIRAALGATPGGVVWLVLKQSVLRVAAGLALGLIGAALLGDFVKRVLSPEVPPRDPVTFVSISLLMATVALVACIIPAWRAARFTPSDALRME